MPARGHRENEMNLEFFGITFNQLDAEVYAMEAKAIEEDPRSLEDIVAAELSRYDDDMARLKAFRVEKQKKLEEVRSDVLKWGQMTAREKRSVRLSGPRDKRAFARANRKLDKVIKLHRAVVEKETIANRSKDPAQREKANRERDKLAKKSDKAMKALQRYTEKQINKRGGEGPVLFAKERYLSACQNAMAEMGDDIVREYTADRAAKALNAHKANAKAYAQQTLARLRAEYLSKNRSEPELTTSDAREQDEFRRETLEKGRDVHHVSNETRIKIDLKDKGISTSRRAPATKGTVSRPKRDRSKEQLPVRYSKKPQPRIPTRTIEKD